jgi:hypothetical protein
MEVMLVVAEMLAAEMAAAMILAACNMVTITTLR